MDDYLRSLGATCMRDTVCADDAKDIEQAFDTWKQEITSILSIYYPMSPTYSYPIDTTGATKPDSKPCCSEPKPGKSGSTCCSTHTNKAAGDSTSCCQNDTHTVTSDTKHSTATKSVLDDELEEEDIINNTFVTYDVPSSDEEEEEGESDEEEGEESDNLFTNLSTQNIGGCGEGNEADVDVEDLGAAISSHRVTAPTSTSTTTAAPFIGPENDPKKRHKFPSNIPVHKGQKFVKKLLTPAAGTVPVLPGEPREMVTKLQRKALIKEGYRIIGSHSAVKLCRYCHTRCVYIT